MAKTDVSMNKLGCRLKKHQCYVKIGISRFTVTCEICIFPIKLDLMSISHRAHTWHAHCKLAHAYCKLAHACERWACLRKHRPRHCGCLQWKLAHAHIVPNKSLRKLLYACASNCKHAEASIWWSSHAGRKHAQCKHATSKLCLQCMHAYCKHATDLFACLRMPVLFQK